MDEVVNVLLTIDKTYTALQWALDCGPHLSGLNHRDWWVQSTHMWAKYKPFEWGNIYQHSLLLVNLDIKRKASSLMLLGCGSQMLTVDWLS